MRGQYLSDLDHFDAPEEGEGQGDDDQQHRDHGEQHRADVGTLTTQSWNGESQALSRSGIVQDQETILSHCLLSSKI